ncbi:hypothetical protein RHSIM_Rhsim09G0013200 [Rhododendron simsii]|uniref:HMA domain-containing protein n=1 Tax=Rhododendron simsii TaxID=118357 RepID=A0A834GIQ3_RHOSS|nr:hypothetical protein RHSIM_Rhsim09G0013200 [Rhododendron simsii]
MKQRVLLKMDLSDEKIKRKVMKTLSSLPGVESFAMNMGSELTVIGDSLDAVEIVKTLRESCGYTEIVSVSPGEEPKSERKMRKVVVKGSCPDDIVKVKAMKALSTISGVESISWNWKDKKMTVIGDMDPVVVVWILKKFWQADMLTVGPVEPSEDDSKEVADEKN